MELINLLETGIPMFGNTYGVSLNWIGNLIRLLISGVGVVGVGIILFSLILKLIVLPFDVYQRIAMRKQNIKMKDNQEKMAKLQKQYANNKELYNQKVMEMYRESGISMFSSCLPMILSLVIFIIAINAFNAFAQYSNIENYNTLVNAYNAELSTHCAVLTEDNAEDSLTVVITDDKDSQGNPVGTKTVTYTVKNEGKYIYYKAYAVLAEGVTYDATMKANEVSYVNSYADKAYFIDVESAKKDDVIKAAIQSEVDAGVDEATAISNYFVEKAQNAVVLAYEE